MGLGTDGRLHFKKCKQVGEEQCLVRNTGKRRENLLDVGARLHNSSGQKSQRADTHTGVSAQHQGVVARVRLKLKNRTIPQGADETA